MADQEHPLCRCDEPFQVHCGSHTCTWMRCGNARCAVQNVDLDTARWQYRDGHVETAPM